MTPKRKFKRWPGRFAAIALILIGVATLLMGGAGPSYRTGLLLLGAAFEMLRYGAFAAVAAGLVGLVAMTAGIWRRDRLPVWLGGLAAAATVALLTVPLQYWQQAQTVPPIHDITTDTDEPPSFKALAAEREQASNAVAYPGEETAREQRRAYPDIAPLRVDAPLAVVLDAAKAEVQQFGWELAATTDNTIEATATTTWFGFQDDVVIRLQEEPESVRIDMRSASRVGRSDVGTNAARIRAFMDALAQRLNASPESGVPMTR